MAASEKTILSSLEEESSENGRCIKEMEQRLINGKGENGMSTDSESSIFKSFFESNEEGQQMDKTSSILLQTGNPEDTSVEQESGKPQKCSYSLSNQLDWAEGSDHVMASDSTSDVVETQLLSRSSQHGTIASTTTEDPSPQRDCLKSELVTMKRNNIDVSEPDIVPINGNDLDEKQRTTMQSDQVETNGSNLVRDLSEKGCGCLGKSVTSSERLADTPDSTNSSAVNASVNESECDVFNKTNDILFNGKENSIDKVTTSGNSTELSVRTDSCMNLEEKVFPVCTNSGAVSRKPMYDKAVNMEESSCESNQFDPFTLSGDEDFSPKAYKPIKRKLNQGSVNLKAQQNVGIFDYSDDLNGEEKRQKLTGEEDLSLPDMNGRKPVSVSYVYSQELVDKANKLIRIEGRAQLVHSLIRIYGILQHVTVIPPRLATETEIVGFHCSEYIDFLKAMKDSDDLSDSFSAEAEAYGLSYDCPVQEDVFETASLIGGATITAAESLINGSANIAVNWCGGWHHAKRDSASGFCYINDIVLGILKLREKFDKVLYVDLDLHHGDGVEEAFYMTPKVMTVSFHKYAFGFFPGSGSLADTGSGRGRLHSVNVPLMDGIGDGSFFSIFTSVMKKVREKFNADAIVIQCGADGLSQDPMASFNLTHVAIAKCVCFLLTWSLPTLLLGGGGYNFPNTAKCWTFLTAMAAGKKLPVDIPEHEHLMEYGPSFELTTSKGNRKDCNTKEHFQQVLSLISKNLNSL